MTGRLAAQVAFSIFPALLFGQASRRAQTFVIAGSVFDSVANTPLPGAVVHAILLDFAATPAFAGISDTAGHYQIGNLPPGHYAVMFEHGALEILGLDARVDTVTMGDRDTVKVDLAVPSGPVVRASACAPQASRGLLAGQIVAARNEEGLFGAAAVVRWMELSFENSKLVAHDREVRTTTDRAGRYRMCGLPDEGDISLQVSFREFRTTDLSLSIPASGALRRDVRLSRKSEIDGPFGVVFVITDGSQNNLASGTVEIASLHRSGTIALGRAAITHLPAGTWVVAVHSIGYVPETIVVDVPSTRAYRVVLNRLPHLLDSMKVRASISADSSILRAASARMLAAHGTLIREDNLSVQNATLASDPVRAATGFRWQGPTKIAARPYVSRRGELKDCQTISEADSLRRADDKKIAIYLDGNRVPGGIMALNRMVPPKDILAIEAYPDVVSAPFQWRQNDTCAVIVFWTKRP